MAQKVAQVAMTTDAAGSTLKLFASGFLQVILVASSTVFLARANYLGAFVFGFLVSLNWTFNVRRAAASNAGQRIAYALGAAFGSVGGLWLAHSF
jgi:hypothetical protein